jgi:hypothetical protein
LISSMTACAVRAALSYGEVRHVAELRRAHEPRLHGQLVEHAHVVGVRERLGRADGDVEHAALDPEREEALLAREPHREILHERRDRARPTGMSWRMGMPVASLSAATSMRSSMMPALEDPLEHVVARFRRLGVRLREERGGHPLLHEQVVDRLASDAHLLARPVLLPYPSLRSRTRRRRRGYRAIHRARAHCRRLVSSGSSGCRP